MQNTNQINIDGSGNITLQNIHGSTVTIHKNDDVKAVMVKLEQLQAVDINALQETLKQQGNQFVELLGLIKKWTPPPCIPPELTINLPKIPDLTKIIGREQDLKQVRDLLQEKQKVVVVNGLGGIGKTSVAQAYLTQYGSEYAHLLWLTQSEGDNFMLDLITAPGLTLNLGIETSEKDTQTLFKEIIALLKSISAEKPNLLVIDNANATLQQYFDYLPKPPQWHVLATSREKMGHFFVKDLDFLTEDDAVLLFRQHCQRITDEAQIKSVLRTIDYYTLTIEILAKTAQRYDTPLSVLQMAIERDLKAEVYIPHKGDKIEKVTSYLLSIFDLSPLSAEEKRLLQHFTALPTNYVPYNLLKSLIPGEEEFGIAPGLQDLSDKGWLLSQAEPEAYKMHRIVLEVVKRKLPPSLEGLSELIRQVGNLLNIDQTTDNPAHKFSVIPYGEAILLLFPDAEEEVMGYLQNELGRVFQALGDYSAAKFMFEKARHSAEVSLGEDHSDTAKVYSNLGTLLMAQGDYDAAKTLLEKAVCSNEASFGEDHPETAIRYSNLAVTLQNLGDYSRARTLLEKVIKIMEDNFSANHPYVAKSYSNLAVLLQILEDYPAAKTLLEKAVRSDEANFGENHHLTAIRYNNLGMVLRELGNYEESKTLLQKALRSDESNFGINHPNTAIRYSNLALVHQDLKEYEQAIQLVFKAYSVYEKHSGQAHPETQKIEKNMTKIIERMLENGWTEEQIKELKKV